MSQNLVTHKCENQVSYLPIFNLLISQDVFPYLYSVLKLDKQKKRYKKTVSEKIWKLLDSWDAFHNNIFFLLGLCITGLIQDTEILYSM